MRLLLLGVCFLVNANGEPKSSTSDQAVVVPFSFGANDSSVKTASIPVAMSQSETSIAPTQALETEVPETVLLNPEADMLDSAEPLPVVEGWGRSLLQGTYFDISFLYWEAKDPAERGQILEFSTQTIPPGTVVPSGGFSTGQPNTDPEMGFRAFLGHRLGDNLAIEAGGFWVNPFEYPILGANSISSSSSLGTTVTTINQVNFVVSDPAQSLQTARIFYSIEVYGVENNVKLLLYNTPRLQVTGLIGAFYVGYVEAFDSNLVLLNTTDSINETFEAKNTILGGQIGVEAEYSIFQYVGIRGFTKLGGGGNFEDFKVRGPTPGTGLLTGWDNIGTHSQQEGQAVVNFGASLVLRITPNIDGHIGYTGLWMSDVIRSMDQIDFNPAEVGNPQLNLITDSVLVGGFTGGVTVRF